MTASDRSFGARPWSRWGLGLVVALAACGGPLDRQDGALALRLEALPLGADRASVVLQSNGRRFTRSLEQLGPGRRPVFTAVPVGPAQVEVSLYGGAQLLARQVGLPIEIELDREVELALNFATAGLPKVAIAGGPGPRRHATWSGPIVLEVEEVLGDSRPVELSVTVAGEAEPTASFSAGRLILTIDPLRAGPLLPAILPIEMLACWDNQLCSSERVDVEVHRQVWSAGWPRLLNVAPVFAPEQGLVVFSGEDGGLHLIEVANGTGTTIPLSGRLSKPMAVRGEVLAIVDEAMTLHGIDLAQRQVRWSTPLGARSTGVAAHGDHFLLGVGSAIWRVDARTGEHQVLAELGAAAATTPTVDAQGIIVADFNERIHLLDPQGRLLARAQVDAPVVVPPLRFGGAVVAIDQNGVVRRFDDAGQALGAPLELGGTVVLPAVVHEGALVIASQRSLYFYNGVAPPSSVSFAVPILGAPTPIPGGAVVVGLRSGQVVRVSPDGEAKTLSRLEELALGAAVLDTPGLEVIVGTATGRVERLRAEEGF